jgi:outer membrane protein OmpA-like peptidoglycan-associated protein
MSKHRLLGALALVVASAGLAQSLAAQSIGDRLKRRVQQKADQALDKAVSCVVGDTACVEKAKKEGKTVQMTDAKGNPVNADSSAATSNASESMKPGEGAWANYDFVPGERVLIAEDFSKDRVGNFPKRFELINGNMEIVEWQGKRWLRVGSAGQFSVALPETLPERFTVEFDLTIPWGGMALYGHEHGSGANSPAATHSVVVIEGTEAGVYRGQNKGESTVDPRTIIKNLSDQYSKSGISEPYRVRIQGDGKYLKVYLNEHRVANIPNADFARTKAITFHFDGNSWNGEQSAPLLGNLSINAGGKELYDALVADGRVATQGILFDTGSDVIKPHSTPTLEEIVSMMKEHSDLKLLIEGHTDNVGDAAANQALSEKRAAAVKAFLVEKGIDAARLDSKGLGATKPKVSNDTPEGRQTNRRVELVKL